MLIFNHPSLSNPKGFFDKQRARDELWLHVCASTAHLVANVFRIPPIVGGGVCKMGQEKIMAACYGTITSNKTNKEVSLIMRRDERTSPEEALKSACSYDLPKGSVVELQYCDLYTAHVQVGSDLKRELAKHGARMEKIRGMKLRSSARRLRDQMGLPAPR